jgi:hypothetical protein
VAMSTVSNFIVADGEDEATWHVELEGEQLVTVIFTTFLLANYRIFLNCFEISVKFCVVLIPIFKLCELKVFRAYLHFFETLKPNSQETAQNFEKVFNNSV